MQSIANWIFAHPGGTIVSIIALLCTFLTYKFFTRSNDDQYEENVQKILSADNKQYHTMNVSAGMFGRWVIQYSFMPGKPYLKTFDQAEFPGTEARVQLISMKLQHARLQMICEDILPLISTQQKSELELTVYNYHVMSDLNDPLHVVSMAEQYLQK